MWTEQLVTRKKMLRYVLIVALLPLALATEGWTPCDDGSPVPTKLEVEGCDSAPCILRRGQSIRYEATFISTKYSENVTSFAHFREIESGITGNFPLPSDQRDTCRRLINSSCPLYPGEEITHELVMPVYIFYPSAMALELTMFVQNDEGGVEKCFKLLATTL